MASYLQDHLCPRLIGRDAHRIEDIWQFFYKGAYWRRGPVTMSAISAVDMALWDIKAKAANMPLYQLLGGASREGVMVYCHTTGHSIDEALDDYARHQELGFKAIRVQCGIPGMKTTYGMSKGKGLAYEPATKGQWPEEQLWSTEKYLDFMPKLFDAVRNKFGFNEHLLHDMHHRLTPIEAARFGKSIEDYRMFWMEDPTPAENQECFRLIRQHTVTPIAVGEVFNSIWDCKQLIEEQLIDYIRTTLTHAGGITGMRRIADFSSEKKRHKLENQIRQAEKRLSELENRLNTARNLLEDASSVTDSPDTSPPSENPIASKPEFTLYRFHEALCYSVTLRTPHRRVLRFKSQHPGELACFISPVA
ncbi:Starvation sensing protein [Shigella flexneri]|uniref:Starvation sensing protein n=2 Tax=Shigella flexneri TaxID=623 RepID=A0A658Z497_SHIFL|nr:Starvation sensing protein [Shigella flexneri]